MIEKAFHFIDRHPAGIAIIAISLAMMVSVCGFVLALRHLQRDLTRLERSMNTVVSFDVEVSPETANAMAHAAVEVGSGRPATGAGSLIDYIFENPRRPRRSRINVRINL